MSGGNTRNLLIIGIPNSGKSTLANVLCGTEDFFEESGYSAKESNNIFKTHEFLQNAQNEQRYRVVDTTINLINLTEDQDVKKFLNRIFNDLPKKMPEGISQVLFVLGNRFTSDEINFFKAFEKSIIGSGICKYTTIVRTSFNKFQDENEREEDKKRLFKENVKIAEILKLCCIIHVDNPPMNTIIRNDNDREMNRIHQGIRNESRNILLRHLEEICSRKKPFKSKMWNKPNEPNEPGCFPCCSIL